MKTKIQNLFVALTLLALPALAQAQVNYAVSGNTAYVTGSPNASGNVVITNFYDGYPVTSIRDRAFAGCYNLWSVTIPNSLIRIGNGAFEECLSLTSVTIPNSVTSIGIGPFTACSSLTNIAVDATNPDYSSVNGTLFDKSQATLLQFPGGLGGNYTVPASVTNIGNNAFYGCRYLTSVTIPATVTSIGQVAFEGCASLTNIAVDAGNPAYSSLNGVLFDKTQATLIEFPGGPGGSYTIPNSVTSIGNSAFAYSSLTSVNIPDSVTTIGESSFGNCFSLTNATIGSGVTSIGDGMFEGSGLTSVTIPSSVSSIGIQAFEGCHSLTSVTIPSSVTNIGAYAFANSGLRSVTIPNSVTSIGESSFGNCFSLTNATIGSGVTSIGDGMFEGSGLTSVTIPSSVTNIGAYAFANSGLRSVTIPNSVTTIGESSFGNCFSLTNATIGSGVTSIGDGMFEGSGLTSVTIPSSVSSIGIQAFEGCHSLTSVTIPNSVTAIGEDAFYYCLSLTSVTIPNSVTSIGGSAFYDCSSLTSVLIPNSVTNIGIQAFEGCTSLTSVTILNSVTSIGYDVFYACTSLTSVTIPNSVTSIGGAAFDNCNSLTNVTIPNSVTNIGAYAFYQCTSLTGVYFQGNSPTPTNDSTVFSSDPATVYYLPGTTGWGAMFDGLPTAPWFLPNPQILNHGPGFGVQPGGFGFTISWATNASVVVEAATNLANPVWIPLSTSPLTSGMSYFSDPQWTNYPERFYRAASAFTVGGTLTGLPAGDTVTLQDNGSDNLTLSTNGTFTFPTALPNGHAYSVTVSGTSGGTPTICTLTNGSGTISSANVTNVAVQFTYTPDCPALTGSMSIDMLSAALSDGTANGGEPGVMITKNGGPFRVTALGRCSDNVCLHYYPGCVFTQIVGTYSCSSTTFPSGTWVIQFGTSLDCRSGPPFGW